MISCTGQSAEMWLREEAGEPVTVDRPLWIVENFFMLSGKCQHEIGLYYLVTLPPASRLLDVTREHAGIEGDVPLVFRWLPTAQLPYLPVYPIFLRAALQALPDTMQHIVNCDDREADPHGGAVSVLP